VEDGLSEFPHVIVNEARIHDHLLGSMRRSPSRLEPDYDLEVVDVAIGDSGDRPVTVTLRRTDTHTGAEVMVGAKYVVGCDGARSAVRQSIGRDLHGDTANHAWGVMDILAVTDFPDIRLKAAIQSGSGGNILVFPARAATSCVCTSTSASSTPTTGPPYAACSPTRSSRSPGACCTRTHWT
jgi:phenol 2-monooxygenase (NADPH)